MPAACPLCGREKHMRSSKTLFGHEVCSKCYYAFANRRQGAFVIDFVVFQIVAFMIGLAVGVAIVMAGGGPEAIDAAALPMNIVLVGLFLSKDGFSGHSPGKLLCGVRAIDEQTGDPIAFGASFKRNLPLLIPLMPLIVAVQLSKGHRWGDGWSHSKVVWKKYAHHPIFAVGPGRTGDPETAQAAAMIELDSMPNVGDEKNPYQAPRM